MNTIDLDLLRQFSRDHAQDAFTELVNRHVNLVFSAALRQVRSPQLAEEVAQSVFADLARDAGRLRPDTVLTAWLYDVTRRTAIDVIRKESRRQLREQIAYEMNAMNADAPDWKEIEPLLDDAMAALDEADRHAVLLRFFENKSLREVGAALGTGDDAAQKRVTRAIERLRGFFARRGVTIGTGALIVLISANAVQSAPAGLAATVATTAILTGTAVPVSALATTTLKALTMTTLQKTLVTAVITVAVGLGIYEARKSAQLNAENQMLEQQQAPLIQQIADLQRERNAATNRSAALAEEMVKARKNPAEVIKLRGEVGALRQENKLAGEKSALNKITSDPAAKKAMRDQQKLGMSMIYGNLAKKLNLSPEMTGKFNDLLADNVMDNIDLITQALHDGKSQAEVAQIFSAADTALQGKVQALLGDDALAQYKDYNQNLASTLSAMRFAATLTGDAAAKADKQNQLQQVIQAQTAAALKNAGLPPDYQVIPILNFANIASEDQANQSLNLLDGIYASVAANSTSFLTPDELASFQNFRTNSLNKNRMALTMNRNLMAPIGK